MDRYIKKTLKKLIPVFLIISNTAVANTTELDNAINKYYAGYPDQAIGMIEPLALSGDIAAQNLLGNILYSLSKTKKFGEKYDPVKWYKMAAEQDSSDANYALGVIYYNKWIELNRKEDAGIALFYYEKAVKLGNKDAKVPLNKLKSQGIAPYKSKPPSKPETFVGQVKQTRKISGEHSKKESDPVKVEESSDEGSEPVKTKVIAKQRTPVENSNNEPDTIYLANIAEQCKNYTQIGFSHYAESIRGTIFVGNAKIDSIGLTPSKSDTRLIELISNQFDKMIFLTLDGVPSKVATGLKNGRDIEVTGVVEDSQMTGSSCVVNLIYQSIQ